jgi:radical SAM protein with 4Fe4S-binding SPASM domain
MKPKNQFGLSQLITLVFQSRLIFFSEGKYWNIRSIPMSNKRNLVLAGLDHLFRRTTALSQPSSLMVEPADVCNLACTGCWTNNPQHKDRSRHLSLKHFEKIMKDLGDYLNVIWLWGWGEPFLNKNIYQMIRMAREKDIVVISSTNGNLGWDSRELEELVKSGLSKLIFAVDGMDQATYSKYRIHGSLEHLLENIQRLVETKKRLGRILPLINMRMLVMAHNEHQTEDFVSLGRSLGVDIVSFKTMCDYRRGDLNADFPVNKKYLRYDIDKLSGQDTQSERYYCYRPWRRLEIFADGAVTPCEFDLDREYLLGRLDDDIPLTALWNNTVMKGFRRQFITDVDKISFCGSCPYKRQVVWDPTVEYYGLTEAART